MGASAVLGTLYVIVTRLQIAANYPLWLDETWSAMIATQSDWPAFWREVWLDCHPPLYYFILRIWAALMGDSNLMLRLPSIIFTISAALVPLIWRVRGLSQGGAWTYAALILLWQPGFFVMLDARSYGLLLLLSTCSCIAFAKMLDELTLRRAAIWVLIGTMMFMTHYYSGAILAGQAIILIYRKGLEITRIWPAAVLTLPGLVWFAYHLPRLADYTRPEVSTYNAFDIWTALRSLIYIFGVGNPFPLGMVVAVFAMVMLERRHRIAQPSDQRSENKTIASAICAAAIGFAIIIAINIFKPSLTYRYLVPLVPSAMFALALVSQRFGREGVGGALLASAFLAPHLNAKATHEKAEARVIYNGEAGSAFIRQYRPDRLLFVWDHPLSPIMDRGSLEDLGGYFLKRAGAGVPVQAIVVPTSMDANVALRAAAHGGRPAILWLFDRSRYSSAGAHPPTFEQDPAWNCLRPNSTFNKSAGLTSIACVKQAPSND